MDAEQPVTTASGMFVALEAQAVGVYIVTALSIYVCKTMYATTGTQNQFSQDCCATEHRVIGSQDSNPCRLPTKGPAQGEEDY